MFKGMLLGGCFNAFRSSNLLFLLAARPKSARREGSGGDLYA
jgi:hypothetical protein